MPKKVISTSTGTNQLPPPPSLVRTIGPSFILLGLALGSGELLLWPYLTANWGLGLIWGALLGISFQYVLNTEIMRYSLAWGESVFVGFRKISVLITLWYILSTFIPWSIPGFSSATTDIIVHFLPWLPKSAVAASLLVCSGLILSLGSSVYKTMETYQRTVLMLGLPFILVLAALLTNSTDWTEYAWGLIGRGGGWWFFPDGVSVASFLGAFAYAGAGGNLNLAQTYYIKDKGFGMGAYAQRITSLVSGQSSPIKLDGQLFAATPINQRRWAEWWRHVTTEHLIIFWFLGLVSISVLSVLAKSTAFGLTTESGLSFLYTESSVIGQRLHPYVGTVFLMVAAVMLFSTQLGVLEASSRIISENVLLLGYQRGKKYQLTKAFYTAVWSQVILGSLIYLAGFREPRVLLTISALLNAAAMMMSFLFLLMLNRRSLAPAQQPSKLRMVIMLLAAVFFAYFLNLTIRR